MDKELQELERQRPGTPEHLIAQMRAGITVPLALRVKPPSVLCGDHVPRWQSESQVLPVVRLRAYLGDPVAREIAGYADACLLCNKPVGFIHLPEHCTHVQIWAQEIPILARDLPPLLVSGVKCDNCVDWIGPCEDCGGQVEISAARYLAVRMTLAVARVVARKRAAEDQWFEGVSLMERLLASRPALDCLDAVAAWTICPCPLRKLCLDPFPADAHHGETWWNSVGWLVRGVDEDDVPPQFAAALGSAAVHLGTEEVRAAACKAGLEVLGG